jgi:hypothetical protein
MGIRLMQVINWFHAIRLNGEHGSKEGFFIRSAHHTAEIISKLMLLGFSQKANLISKADEIDLAN